MSVAAGVQVLDLRGRPDGQSHGTVGRVIVLDHAASLVDHWDTYTALADDREVTGVICLAIGAPSAEAEGNGTHSSVVLRIPAVLTQSGGAVLWVGDEHGVRWGTRANQPVPLRPAANELTGLERLVLALHVDEVFDEVRAQVQEEMPGQVASPGLVLFSGAVVSGQLVAARDAAVQQLVGMRHDQAPTQALLDTIEELRRGPQATPGGDLDGKGRVGAPRELATKTRTTAADLARDARSLRLFTGSRDRGGERPGPLLGRVAERSGTFTAKYREEAATLLDRVDGHLRRGDTSLPKVVEMGVREPPGVSPEHVVENLGPAVAKHLGAEPSLPALATHLRRAAAALEPAGCPGVADTVRGTGQPSLARGLPTATQWPVSPVLLPLVFLTCVVAALVPSPPWLGWIVGALAVLAWFVPAWMLLARWPQSDGELEPAEASVPVALSFGLVGIAGAVAGAWAARYLADLAPLDLLPGLPTRWRVFLVVVAFLLIVLAVRSSWSLAARRLRKRLGTEELAAVHRTVSGHVDRVVGTEWVPSARRRVVAAALNETADGLHEIQRRLAPDPDDAERPLPLFSRAPSRFTPAALPGGVPNALAEEVQLVVHDDLLRIVAMALEPAWRATRKGRRAHPGEYTQRLDGLLEEYDDHVYHSGLMTVPRQVEERDPVPNEKPRQELLSRVWGEAPQARRALRTQPFDDTTQLCTPRQIGDLYTYREPVMVRFAPAQVRRVLAAPGSRDAAAYATLVWTERAELAGVVRLHELQAGARETIPVGGRR
jgi:hypothetical protein